MVREILTLDELRYVAGLDTVNETYENAHVFVSRGRAVSRLERVGGTCLMIIDNEPNCYTCKQLDEPMCVRYQQLTKAGQGK